MQGKCAAKIERPKPHVGRVDFPDGSFRLVGVCAAARYLGCTAQALQMAVKGIEGRGTRILNRAREEFPGLFAGEGG